MRSNLSIGEFSRATLLSVKTLRHYHEVGLLEPADVDPSSGRRRDVAEQIPTAQVIRRFRSLDMPVDEIRTLLTAPDPAGRNEVITAHLDRLEATLQRTSAAVASLRDLLLPSAPVPEATIEHRLVEAIPAAAIHGMVEMKDLALWFEGAFGEIYATLAAQATKPDGPGGGAYANELFTDEHGQATVFVPCRERFRASGRVEAVIVPAVELAVATHTGHHSEADRTYGSLATHVAEHALAVDGPIRKYYLVSSRETTDASQWRTEVGWPIFHRCSPIASPDHDPKRLGRRALTAPLAAMARRAQCFTTPSTPSRAAQPGRPGGILPVHSPVGPHLACPMGQQIGAPGPCHGGHLPTRPADKVPTQAVRALSDPRAWGRWGVPGPVAKRAGESLLVVLGAVTRSERNR